MVVYGPYLRKDGRKHVIHYDEILKTKRTQSYPRYLMELHLGRELTSEEEVDHINGNFTDDRIQNLQLLTQRENKQKSIIETGRSEKFYEFDCPNCKKRATIPYRQYKHNQLNNGKTGPFCSRSCAGQYMS